MAFVEINKGAHGRLQADGAVKKTIRMSARPKGEHMGASIGIFPTIAVIEELMGEKLDVSDDRQHTTLINLKVLEGVGDDVGYWLMVHDPNGYAVTLSKKGAYTLTIAVTQSKLKHYVVADGPAHAPENCEFAVDSDRKEILIKVPDWLLFNPSSVYASTHLPKPESAVARLNRNQRRRLGRTIAKSL